MICLHEALICLHEAMICLHEAVICLYEAMICLHESMICPHAPVTSGCQAFVSPGKSKAWHPKALALAKERWRLAFGLAALKQTESAVAPRPSKRDRRPET
jgi:hypothetical protein